MRKKESQIGIREKDRNNKTVNLSIYNFVTFYCKSRLHHNVMRKLNFDEFIDHRAIWLIEEHTSPKKSKSATIKIHLGEEICD